MSSRGHRKNRRGNQASILAPISIQIDQQDSVSLRDAGIIQLYAESSREAYDLHFMAFRIAEDPEVLLPVMVCIDGWVLTHNYEPVAFLDQGTADRFLPPFKPVQCLDVNDPLTYRSHAEDDVLMEMKYSIHDAMIRAKRRIKDIMGEYQKLTGRHFGGLVEAYQTDGSEVILVGMGSMTGTVKDAVDEMRRQGIPVGLVKVFCYRPFPYEDILEATRGARIVSVMDMNFSMGSEGATGMDLKAKLCNLKDGPIVLDFITGLAGRFSLGKSCPKKNLPAIAAAHGIAYVATASIAYPRDLNRKVKKALNTPGAKYIEVSVPCCSGWGFAPRLTLQVGRLGVQSGLIPLYEIERGEMTKVQKIKKKVPVEAYLRVQGRFRHLFRDEGGKQELVRIQKIADDNIERLGLL